MLPLIVLPLKTPATGDFRDSRDSREAPECGRPSNSDHFLEILETLSREFRDSMLLCVLRPSLKMLSRIHCFFSPCFNH